MRNKRFLRLALLLFILIGVFSSATFAQKKIDKYCEVIIQNGTMINPHAKVQIVKWKDSTLFSFKDSTIKINLWNVETLKSTPDVLNYMSKNGWQLIKIIVNSQVYDYYNYYFKREFDQSELSEDK